MNIMKLIYKVFAAAAGILALSSCVEDAIQPLTGKYEKPASYELNTLVAQSVEKGDKTRTFTVELSGSNATLSMKLVGDKYFLADGSYTPATADQAKKNTYIVGNGGTTFNNIPVESGSIKIAQGTGTYSFSGILWLADESIVDFKSTVNLAYEPDPEPIKLTQVISATSNVANGTNSVTINLGTDGISSTIDPSTWQTVWTGEGNYLAVDFYSADGFLYPGTYKPSATGGVIAEGEYGIGWDPGDLWGIGMVFENWGTCWWTVSGGATSAEKISEGDIIVEKSGSKYTITYNHNGLWMVYSGKIEAVDPNGGSGSAGDDTDYTELTNLISATSNVANGTKSLTMNLGTDGISSTTDPTTWQTVWTGTGNYLALDIYSADGYLHEGTYTACAVGGTINEDDHMFGLSCAKKYGGVYVPPHQAVIHQFAREMLAGGGKMILGSDSHTRYGALGTMAMGEGGPELVKQLLNKTYDIKMPGVVAIYLDGAPSIGVGPQDVALAIIGATFANGYVNNKVMEFVGPGVAKLSADFRIGIDVMTTETTCLSSIWKTDEKIQEFYAIHGRADGYKELNPADIALILEEAEKHDLPWVFRILPKELAAEVFVEMESDMQQHLIESFSDSELKGVMDELFMDDAVDIIDEMPASVAKRILKQTDSKTRQMINKLLAYPDSSAGSVMTTEYLNVKRNMTVDEAFDHIRKNAVDTESVYTCYVTDRSRKLLGVVTVKELLLSSPDTLIEDLMETNIISAGTLDDKEEVANLFEKYDLYSLPIVDKEDRLVGIITVDDAIDVMQEEASEDIEKMAAILPSEKSYLKTGVFETFRSRIPWLLFLMISATVTGAIITSFEGRLSEWIGLIAFIPMLMGTGGNSGSQSSVTVIRALSLDELEFSDIGTVLWKEIRTAVLCGVALAAVCFVKIWLVDKLLFGNSDITLMVDLVVCLALAVTVVVAKIVGCLLPIGAKALKLDPAVMASPFISTIVDALSLLVYFLFAKSLLHI